MATLSATGYAAPVWSPPPYPDPDAKRVVRRATLVEYEDGTSEELNHDSWSELLLGITVGVILGALVVLLVAELWGWPT